MTTFRPRRPDPRYRPPGSPPRPDPDPVTVARWRQLAEHPTCQWQHRGVRCVAEAADVVVSRAGVPRSSCERHVPVWFRAGARPLGRSEG